jgi:Protein of unknown function (DUF4011)
MLNYKHRAGSRRQLRIVNTDLESVFAELTNNPRELIFVPLPEPDDIPEDERTESFVAALGYAKSTDIDYLTRLTALDAVARQDDASLAQLERWLRDRIREQLELPPRPNRQEFNLVDHARKKSINPSYELAVAPSRGMNPISRLQTMFFADELDSRLARISADARLSEQETGLSTLFLAFGFLRWYESNASEVINVAPLLLLPVQIAKRMQGRRAIYSIKAAAETPEINLSLRELLLRDSPDVSRNLPDFDDEADGVESYFDKVRDAIEGLNRWRIERNLTLGHFAFGRLAMYADLSPENWPGHTVDHPLLQNLLRGSEAEGGGDLLFASDYDLDDEAIENLAPILINDADASQHSGIVDVMNGKNLVIEGPPGTGKSQTITNIIANALYAGKTILFLAEKLAALEVVKDRLDSAGLGEFCLELHSDKAHPKALVESLQQRHEMTRTRSGEPNWREELQRLRSARGRVREYLAAIHKPEEQDSRTPFELIWSSIASRRELTCEFDAVRRLDLGNIFSSNWQEIEQCQDALKLYAQAIRGYVERHGPMKDAVWAKTGFSPAVDDDPDVIADNIRDTFEGASELIELIATASSNLTFDLPTALSTLKEWLKAVARIPAIPESNLLPQLSSFTPTGIETAVELAAERLALDINSHADMFRTDPTETIQLAQEVGSSGLLALSPSEIVIRAATMATLQERLIDSLKAFSPLITAFQPPSKPDVSMAQAMAAAVKLVGAIPPELDQFGLHPVPQTPS